MSSICFVRARGRGGGEEVLVQQTTILYIKTTKQKKNKPQKIK